MCIYSTYTSPPLVIPKLIPLRGSGFAQGSLGELVGGEPEEAEGPMVVKCLAGEKTGVWEGSKSHYNSRIAVTQMMAPACHCGKVWVVTRLGSWSPRVA